MKKNIITIALLLVSCLLSACEEPSISVDNSNSEISQSESSLDEITNEIEDIIPLTINLKVGELYDITIEEDIEVILSNDNVFYNETHKDLIALEEGNTNVEIYLKDNPNTKTYLKINITNEDIWLSDVPNELFLTVGETIYFDIPDNPSSYRFYLSQIFITKNIDVEIVSDYDNNFIYKINGIEEGCTTLTIYEHNDFSTSESRFKEKNIKIFVNDVGEKYSTEKFYESYTFDPLFNKEYFDLKEFEIITSKKEILELFNYCLRYESIPYNLINLDFEQYSVLTVKRNYSDKYSIKKYYGIEINNNKMTIYQKNYGNDVQDTGQEIDLVIIPNEIILELDDSYEIDLIIDYENIWL